MGVQCLCRAEVDLRPCHCQIVLSHADAPLEQSHPNMTIQHKHARTHTPPSWSLTVLNFESALVNLPVSSPSLSLLWLPAGSGSWSLGRSHLENWRLNIHTLRLFFFFFFLLPHCSSPPHPHPPLYPYLLSVEERRRKKDSHRIRRFQTVTPGSVSSPSACLSRVNDKRFLRANSAKDGGALGPRHCQEIMCFQIMLCGRGLGEMFACCLTS